MSALSPNELVAAWRTRAQQLEKYAPAAARAFADCADELEAALTTTDGSPLVGLNDASRISGYSADHLGRLVRQKKLANYGTPRRPRVRVADLPRKPQALTTPPAVRMLRAQ